MALIYLPQSVNNVLKRIFLTPGSFLRASSACICSKEFRDPSIKKPAPWPYETKKFTFFHSYIEGTVKRFDENTKIIVVDGNLASGKTTFAKQLAEAFDMKYIPEPSVDCLYITPYGYDLRELDPIMPPSFKSCVLSTFYKNPHHRNVAMFQYKMFMLRYENYIDALAHLLNTGQGIVMDRCVYGDMVFMEAMHKSGYISKPARDLYVELNVDCTEELLRPNLIIYLDISSDTALERIKERKNPAEMNSKVLNKNYLDRIEYEYKHHYLKLLERHAELLIYDWTNFGDVEVVVEDIERIDFDRFGKYDEKQKDWRQPDDWTWSCLRRKYTNDRSFLLNYMTYFRPAIKEVHHPAEEVIEYRKIIMKVPGETYAEGFNHETGDSIYFNLGPKSYYYKMRMRH